MLAPSFGVSRTFDATLKRLWTAFTDKDELAGWALGPGAKILRNDMNLSVGGSYRFGVETSDGLLAWGVWDIRRIEPPSLLTFVFLLTDERGEPARGSFGADWPSRLRAEFRFAEQYGGATVTVNLSPLDATEAEAIAFRSAFRDLSEGWERALGRLEARLKPFPAGSS